MVERRLAACGQILGPIDSTYWWEGKIETEREWICLFTTTTRAAPRLREFLLDAHTYDVPEVVGTTLDLVSSDYSDWIDDETDQ